MGDAASDVLADGTFMLQQPCNTCLTNPDLTVDDALLNAKNLTWRVIPATGKTDPNDEEGWTLEPNGQLLTVDIVGTGQHRAVQPARRPAGASPARRPRAAARSTRCRSSRSGRRSRCRAATRSWSGPARARRKPPTPCTDDQAVADGALHVQDRAPGAPGPEIPTIGNQEYGSTDGPGSVLPDGNVLFDVSACLYDTPTHFFVYDPSANTLTQIPDAPNAQNDTSFQTRMLALPNGQILYNDGSNEMEVYTAGGTPNPAWAPSITSLSSSNLGRGGTYNLSGKQLAGLDPGATYGDDVQDNTNFPLVRITNDATGVVTYARTHDWSSVSVAPGAGSSTEFTLPGTTPRGRSTLVVVANGIASSPRTVTIS